MDEDQDESLEDFEVGIYPYENRRIGGSRKETAKRLSKNKYPVCDKGFNSRSQFVNCLCM